MTSVPNEFPSGSPLDLAKVTRTQVVSQIQVNKDSVLALRAKYGDAMTEASVEAQAINALEKGIGLFEMVLPLLGL